MAQALNARIPLYDENGNEVKEYLEVDIRRLLVVVAQASDFLPVARIVRPENED